MEAKKQLHTQIQNTYTQNAIYNQIEKEALANSFAIKMLYGRHFTLVNIFSSKKSIPI